MANESSASPTNALIRIHLHLGMQLIDALIESCVGDPVIYICYIGWLKKAGKQRMILKKLKRELSLTSRAFTDRSILVSSTGSN